MKIGACFLILLCLDLLGAISAIIGALVLEDRRLLLLTLALLAFGFFLLILFRLAASEARCPLCLGPIFLSRRCQRNHRAERAFGSYRLRVAGSILFTNTFKCPYCGESTRCTARKRPG